MEHDPSRRQYAPTSYASQQQQQQSQAAGPTTQYAPTGAVGRFRNTSYIPQSPTSAPSARVGADTTPYYGFQQGAQYPSAASLQQSPMQYTPEMQQTDTVQRQQPQQQISQYQTSIMYGMPQPQAPQTPQSAYEPQYRQRPNTASETLATQFGVPQTAQYYLAGPSAPTSATASDFPSQPLPSQYQQHESYAQQQPGAPSASQVYASAMMDQSSSSAYSNFGQQSQQYAQQQQQVQSHDQAFDEYQRYIRQISTMVNDGTLRDVDQCLLHISQYLLGNAERLELTKDDQSQHDYRIRLWDEFNRTWLTTLQRQHDLTEESLQSGRGLREPQSILSAQALERLAQELIRLCDSVEGHGLVDYQMGVAEEDIIDLLLECLNLLDPNNERAPELATAAGALRSR